jgi:hypothetical protein
MKLYRNFNHHRKLSKKVALLITRALWQWLADNPDSTCKSNWPGWSRISRIYGYPEAMCPCCEYAIQERGKRIGLAISHRCDYCPLLGYAWCSPDPYACQTLGSPYNVWCNSIEKRIKYGNIVDTQSPHNQEQRRQASLLIVEGCNKALKDLEVVGKEV